MTSADDSGLGFAGRDGMLQSLPPAGHALVKKAWNQYVENDDLDVARLRPEVARSWQRCRTLNIDPLHEPQSDVSSLLLRERLASNQNLLNIARPFMENLYAFVKGSGFEVILTDESGVVLEVLGDYGILSRSRRVQLCPGGNWSEACKATNAIGTAIIEKRPVQVHAFEHYCQTHHFLTCSAAPIFNPDGRIIGVLDISGDYRIANPHTLGMVVAAVNAVENQFRLQRATAKLYTAYRYSNILLENMSDGLIAMDNNGIVTEINARGADIFGVDAAQVKGRHITHIHRDCAAILPVVSATPDNDQSEIILKRMGRDIASSASLLRDDDGFVIGTVAILREVGRHPVRRPLLVHAQRYKLEDIVGSSPAIAALKEWAKLAAASPFTVLISGETGTGKELFAQAIHTASPRMDRPFVAINCGALPETLIESELFGYEEGSFTGAKRGGQAGKFEIADGGTIFLDEIGDMSISVQMKLLRVIQERRVTRIGSAHERAVDVRIIAATHKNLSREVQEGRFREDLYYRLNVLEMRVPPLRERMEDVPALAKHLVDKIALRLNGKAIPIGDDFLSKLQSYSWPGNIRELENAIESAVIRACNASILTADLLDFRREAQSTAQPANVQVRRLGQVEKDAVAEALISCNGVIQRAAAKLGIARNTLYRKMKKYDLQ